MTFESLMLFALYSTGAGFTTAYVLWTSAGDRRYRLRVVALAAVLTGAVWPLFWASLLYNYALGRYMRYRLKRRGHSNFLRY